MIKSVWEKPGAFLKRRVFLSAVYMYSENDLYRCVFLFVSNYRFARFTQAFSIRLIEDSTT